MPIRVFTEEEKQDIRVKMLTAGLELIKKYGLTHTSVSKITEAAKIGKSTFYNFYTSKEFFLIDLIKYERGRSMNYFQTLLNGREKITVEEAKKFIKMIIFHQDSIYQYLTEKDLVPLYPVMKEQGMIESDLNSNTPAYLLSHIENINPNANQKVLVNMLRIMALTISQKESLHEDALEETYNLMFESLFAYIFI